MVIQYLFLFHMLGGVGTAFSRYPIIYLLLGCDVLLMALGIWSGILIWDLRAKGVRVAKVYLVLGVLIPAALAFGVQALGMGGLAEQLGGSVARALVFNTIWFVYLVMSERVRNLYEIESSNPPAP